MRRIKKCTVFLLLLCLLLNLAGCAAAQKPLRVTLVLKTVTEVAEFWGTLLSGVEKAAEEYGVELKVLTSPREIDIDKQIELIRQVTADKPDVMILSAADYDRCAEATEEAIAAGIGVVAIDTDVNARSRARIWRSTPSSPGRGWRWAAPWHPICRRAERSRSFSIC